MNKKLWSKFEEYGSGFILEAERDYKQRHYPLIYHLKMFGLYYPKDYELVGKNLDKLIKEAIEYTKSPINKELKSSMRKLVKMQYASK